MSYLNTDEAYEYNDLACWYQNSIDETQSPIWTDEHLEELLNDFYIIPKDTPTADVVPKSEVEKDFDDLKRYIILNEDIAIKCKRENGVQNEEYWKGKISAFRQIRAYIDAELKKKYTESEDKE